MHYIFPRVQPEETYLHLRYILIILRSDIIPKGYLAGKNLTYNHIWILLNNSLKIYFTWENVYIFFLAFTVAVLLAHKYVTKNCQTQARDNMANIPYHLKYMKQGKTYSSVIIKYSWSKTIWLKSLTFVITSLRMIYTSLIQKKSAYWKLPLPNRSAGLRNDSEWMMWKTSSSYP